MICIVIKSVYGIDLELLKYCNIIFWKFRRNKIKTNMTMTNGIYFYRILTLEKKSTTITLSSIVQVSCFSKLWDYFIISNILVILDEVTINHEIWIIKLRYCKCQLILNFLLFFFRSDRAVHSHEDDAAVCRPASSLELQNLRSFSGKNIEFS